METENNNQATPRFGRRYNSGKGRVLAGLIIICVGVLLLARQSGVVFPEWLFTWQMLLIVLGLFIGAKHSFRSGGWIVPLLIGAVFMVDEFIPGLSIGRMVWPLILIVAGLFMIFRPKRSNNCDDKWSKWKDHTSHYNNMGSDDMLDSVSVFGGVKKNIISKDFKGGEVTCIFGGAEINLTQADINGKVVLDVTQIFGGTKLILPANWEVKPEMVAFLGGIEDKRAPQAAMPDSTKILILRGTTIFGGIDIRSY
jgi:predicted membrane protein